MYTSMNCFTVQCAATVEGEARRRRPCCSRGRCSGVGRGVRARRRRTGLPRAGPGPAPSACRRGRLPRPWRTRRRRRGLLTRTPRPGLPAGEGAEWGAGAAWHGARGPGWSGQREDAVQLQARAAPQGVGGAAARMWALRGAGRRDGAFARAPGLLGPLASPDRPCRVRPDSASRTERLSERLYWAARHPQLRPHTHATHTDTHAPGQESHAQEARAHALPQQP
jgi:hypothetical protein